MAPRDGSSIYHLPDPDVAPDTTIESAVYNNLTNDVEQDLNLPRPIVAGGTGASSAAGALAALGGETAQQVVTNYDSFPFKAGSFLSAPGATSAPTPGASYAGICYVYASDYMTIEARMTTAPGTPYVRQKVAGVWGAWAAQAYVDTVTSALTANAAIASKITATTGAYYFGNGSTRSVAHDGTSYTVSGGPFGVLSNIVANGGYFITALTATTGTYYFGNSGTKLFSYDGTKFNLTGGPLALTDVVTLSSASSTLPLLNGALNIGYEGGGSRYGINLRPATDVTSAMTFLNAANSVVGNITQTSTNTAYNTSSDVRLKDDFKSFDAGRIIDGIEIYDFAWKGTNARAHGVSAQQAYEVYPEAVTYFEARDWWGVDYSKYVPILLQEIKALRERVAALEAPR